MSQLTLAKEEHVPFLAGTCSVVVLDSPDQSRSNPCSPTRSMATSRGRTIVVMDIGPDTTIQLNHPSVVWNRNPVLGIVCLLSLVTVQFSAEMTPFVWSVPGGLGSFIMLVGALLATCTCCTTRNISIQAVSLLAAGSVALVCDALSIVACIGIGFKLEWMPDKSTALFMVVLYAVHAALCALLIQHAYHAKRLLAPPPHGCPAV